MLRTTMYVFPTMVILAVVAWATVARADIRRGTTEECSIHIEGNIKRSDAQMAFQLLGVLEWRGNQGDRRSRTVCLDSEGGSYIAAREIANLFYDVGVDTYVRDGSACFSACAIIFMSGRNEGEDWDFPSRHLHKNAKLGFHAPYFPLEDNAEMRGRDVRAMFELHNAVISDLIRFSRSREHNSKRSFINVELLQYLFDAGPSELVMVDTVGRAVRWGIEVYGFSKVENFGAQGAVNACINYQSWARDLSVREADTFDSNPYESVSAEHELGGSTGDVKSFKVDLGGMVESFCIVEVSAKEPNLALCSRDQFTDTYFGNCRTRTLVPLSNLYLLKEDTALSDLR